MICTHYFRWEVATISYCPGQKYWIRFWQVYQLLALSATTVCDPTCPMYWDWRYLFFLFKPKITTVSLKKLITCSSCPVHIAGDFLSVTCDTASRPSFGRRDQQVGFSGYSRLLPFSKQLFHSFGLWTFPGNYFFWKQLRSRERESGHFLETISFENSSVVERERERERESSVFCSTEESLTWTDAFRRLHIITKSNGENSTLLSTKADGEEKTHTQNTTIIRNTSMMTRRSLELPQKSCP